MVLVDVVVLVGVVVLVDEQVEKGGIRVRRLRLVSAGGALAVTMAIVLTGCTTAVAPRAAAHPAARPRPRGESTSTGKVTAAPIQARPRPIAPSFARLGHPATVTLTFDDGPYPHATVAILALLSAHHVRAVFCEVGKRALASPQIVRQVVAAGNVLCDHTVHHYDDLDTVSPTLVRREVLDGYADLVSASGGVRPRYYRAPQGRWTAPMWRDAAAAGMTNLYWSVDPLDWARLPADRVVANVLAGLRPGGIVLLHDRDGLQTLAAVRQLLVLLPQLGYRFALPAPTYSFGLAAALAADRGTRAFSVHWRRTHPHWHVVAPA